ncbi:MAG: integrase [Variovorax paradoxus]|nr:MAG: integrase [Variovorax paradoxus]PZQ15181.1 MAG: integrase [Variovorax paradoxus]
MTATDNEPSKKVGDLTLRAWLRAGAIDKGIGGGLTFVASAFAASKGQASWVLRYRFAGKSKEKWLGRYPDISLQAARELARTDRAQVQQGVDVAAQKQHAKILEQRRRPCLALRRVWHRRYIVPHYGKPDRIEATFERYVDPIIGHLMVDQVEPEHIERILDRTVKAGAPTVANDLLRYLMRMFDFAVRKRYRPDNPTIGFTLRDAGGTERARTRWLDCGQLAKLATAMRETENFGRINEISVWLLLALCVRKMELLSAKKAAFNFQRAQWALAGDDTKTRAPLIIPLPDAVMGWLEEAMVFSGKSEYLFPARRRVRSRLGEPAMNRFPHISPDTLNVALGRLTSLEIAHFTVHDMRRTARTHLARMGVAPDIAERALNHAIQSTEGIYNQYDYMRERRMALSRWADYLHSLEKGNPLLDEHEVEAYASSTSRHASPLTASGPAVPWRFAS